MGHVEAAKGQLVVLGGALVLRRPKVTESVVHPTQIPFRVEAQPCMSMTTAAKRGGTFEEEGGEELKEGKDEEEGLSQQRHRRGGGRGGNVGEGGGGRGVGVEGEVGTMMKSSNWWRWCCRRSVARFGFGNRKKISQTSTKNKKDLFSDGIGRKAGVEEATLSNWRTSEEGAGRQWRREGGTEEGKTAVHGGEGHEGMLRDIVSGNKAVEGRGEVKANLCAATSKPKGRRLVDDDVVAASRNVQSEGMKEEEKHMKKKKPTTTVDSRDEESDAERYPVQHLDKEAKERKKRRIHFRVD